MIQNRYFNRDYIYISKEINANESYSQRAIKKKPIEQEIKKNIKKVFNKITQKNLTSKEIM